MSCDLRFSFARRTTATKKKKKKKKSLNFYIMRRSMFIAFQICGHRGKDARETFVWIRAETSGCPPSKRESHTCSSRKKNRIIVIGGEDSNDYYLSDVHILDTDSCVWTKVMATGEGPVPRYSMSGGCNGDLDALDDMYYLHTGFTLANERDERRLEKLSLRKQLKLKCQEQSMLPPVHDKVPGRVEMNGDCSQPIPVPIREPSGCNGDLDALDDMYYLHAGFTMANEQHERRQLKLKCQEQSMLPPVYDKVPGRVEMNGDCSQPFPVPIREPSNPKICLKEYLHFLGTKRMPAGYSVETVIDGKVLHGIVFTSDISSNNADENSRRSNGDVEIDAAKLNDNQNSNSESVKPARQTFDDVSQSQEC